MNEELNIVVPMAGRGSRFRDVGYQMPKPLIPVRGVEMIRLVIENLRPRRPHRFVFLCLDEHLKNFHLGKRLMDWAPGCKIVSVDQVTEGAACTVLLSTPHIDSRQPLMIANCDQWVDIDIDRYLESQDAPGVDGLIMTMKASDPKWSYARVSANGRVTEVVEKVVVSDEATVGIYNFKRGEEFVAAAESMIGRNLRVNGEFYVAPAYNQLIERGRRIAIFNVGTVGNGMYGLGTPADLEAFIDSEAAMRAVKPLF